MKADVIRRAVAGVALAASIVVMVDAQAPTPAGVIAPLERFAGTWFEISAYGSWWQRRCVRDTTLAVTPRSENDADLRSRCRTVVGHRGERCAGLLPGQWGRRPMACPLRAGGLPAVAGAWADFWVLGHDARPELVRGRRAGPSAPGGVLPTVALDESAVAQAMGLARQAGFEIVRLVRAMHDPDEWRTPRE